MAALARWCFQRRTWVLVAWLALVIILGVGGRAAGTAYSNNVTLPGTGSTIALTLLEKAFPGHAGDQDTIVGGPPARVACALRPSAPRSRPCWARSPAHPRSRLW